MRPMIAGLLIAGLSISSVGAARAGDVSTRPRRGGDAYAFVIDENTLNGSVSVRDLDSIMRRFPGQYLWLRRNGREYVVLDRKRFDEGRRLFDASDPKRRSLEAAHRNVARREKELDREIDGLEESDAGDVGELDAASRQGRDELDARRRALEEESRALEAKEQALDRESDAIDRAAEARLWALVDRWIADGTARPLP